jgi:hypothetical protein
MKHLCLGCLIASLTEGANSKQLGTVRIFPSLARTLFKVGTWGEADNASLSIENFRPYHPYQ